MMSVTSQHAIGLCEVCRPCNISRRSARYQRLGLVSAPGAPDAESYRNSFEEVWDEHLNSKVTRMTPYEFRYDLWR